ncbi:MAG: hypothetical protein Q4C34_02945 [Bacteroidales bacterium]|nr:hypothetical protein [Bacteroidales bacterium]
MKIVNYLFIGAMAIAGIGMTACSRSSKQADETIDSIAPVKVLSVDSVMAQAESLVGDTVTVEGLCTHLCKHGGRKAFLANADTTVMVRCEATQAIGGAFSPDCVGKTLTVEGVWQAQRLGRSEIAGMAEAQNSGNDGHCDTEQKASGPAAGWLKTLDEQIAAGGDTTIVVGYFLEASSYSVPVE